MQRTIILSIILVIFSSTQVLALEAGGKFEVLLSGVLENNGSYDGAVSESLDLEFFLPRLADNELRYEVRLSKPLQDLLAGENVSVFSKKLYLKHRFDTFHLTVGRQPVSWSFGSLLNPVDYTLGAVALDEESNSKYTDAVEAYIPLNWNSSLALVTSFPGGFTTDTDKMKWGFRGRMGVQGYDLTVNYVQEPAVVTPTAEDSLSSLAALIPQKRLGFTAKGDVGNFGVYGSFGHYFGSAFDSINSYLLGADYSYNIGYNRRINMQLEYLALDVSSLDFLTGSLSYPIDDFSSISLISMISLEDSSLMLIPSYRNTLPSNIDLTINSAFAVGEGDSLFASGSLIPKVTTSVNLSYPF